MQRFYSKDTKYTLILIGRSSYTAEEDDAILSYVIKHREQTGGNRLWQKMEKLRVTSHSWQSMKYHYRQKLGKMLSEVTKVNRARTTVVFMFQNTTVLEGRFG